MGVFIGIILLFIMAIPMIGHYHRNAVRESYDASCERLKGDPVALQAFQLNRWDGR